MLELEVDGRRHLEAATEDTAGAVFLDELVLDVVDEVLRRPLCAGEMDVLRVGERRRVRPPEVAPRDLPLVEHGREDVPSPLLGARRVGDGVVPARIGGDPGEERSLREIELLGALLEVRTRCLLDPVRAVPEVDRVQVRGEDPILAPALLELPRERSFAHLAGDRPLVPDVGVLDELLRDRRAALDDRLAADVGPEGASDAADVDAVVVEEALVLGRDDRLAHDRSDVLGADEDAALVSAQNGEHRPSVRRVDDRVDVGALCRGVERRVSRLRPRARARS